MQEADAGGQVFGVEAKDWMPLSSAPWFFNQTSYDIRDFCAVQGFPLTSGHSYVVTYDTDGPSPATSKLVHIQGCPTSCEPHWSPAFGSAQLDGAVNALYAGGSFSSAGGNPEQNLARWAGCGPSVPSWPDLGGGTVGGAGSPTLGGTGPLVGGTMVTIGLTNAPPAALTLQWVSLAPTPFEALGGTVHAFPYAIQRFFQADVAGELSLSTTWPAGIASGTQVWFQFIVQDLSVPSGLTLSNGLKATTP